jgi:hypothetical protein
MKAALLESDIVLTVSPNYAKELTAGPDKGVELDTIVSKAGVLGIVNGMDVQEWDPLEDEHLSIRYNCNTVWLTSISISCHSFFWLVVMQRTRHLWQPADASFSPSSSFLSLSVARMVTPQSSNSQLFRLIS